MLRIEKISYLYRPITKKYYFLNLIQLTRTSQRKRKTTSVCKYFKNVLFFPDKQQNNLNRYTLEPRLSFNENLHNKNY